MSDQARPKGAVTVARRGGWAMILATAGMALTATLVAYGVAMSYADGEAAQAVRDRAHDLHEAMEEKLADYAYAAMSGRGLFAASKSVERAEWRAYVAALDLQANYPGVIGFAYLRAVDDEELAAFEAETRADGAPWFSVRSNPMSQRPSEERIIVTYHEPEARNRPAIGFDSSTMPVAAEAYRRSRDTGRMAMSEPLSLVQEGVAGRLGVLMSLPVYRAGEPTSTVAERRAALHGWVALPLLLSEVYESAWAGAYGDLSVRLTDAGRTLLDAGGEGLREDGEAREGWVNYAGTIEVGGRSWEVKVAGEPVAMGAHLWIAWLLLAGGLGLSAMLTGMVWSLHRTRARALELAEQMTTELREQAGELDAARRSAEASSATKSQFLANMSHEIRTPMTAILGYADLLDEPSLDAEGRADCVGVIRRNGRQLLEIINDILDLSKIEAGMMKTERVETPLRETVLEVASLLRVRAEEKGLELSVEFDASLPATAETDPVRLRQVLTNLVGNAIKFTERGSVRVEARAMEGSWGGAWLRFEVVDTGIGITEEQMARLFSPFAQADASMTRKFGGTGLGLTVSKRLAEMLGGDIAVTSEPGMGSRFVLTIETSASAEADGVAEVEGGEATDEATASGADEEVGGASEAADPSRRVLLVDDGEDNRRLVAYMLGKAGYAVETATNGQEAVDEVMSGREYAVVLMDMQMPVKDGYTATRELRSAGYAGTIVALTAHAMSGDRERCLAAGCDDYVAKPIDLPKLMETIERLRGVAAGTSAAA